MKQYVLDEPPPAAPPPVEAVGLPRQPWPWRALLVLALVEPLALGALYLALDADARPVAAAQPIGPATIAAFSLPPSAEPAAAAVASTEAPAGESRIAVERGRYVVDLRSTEIGPALAMLAQATKATVHGADALAREPTRLSRSAVVATPAEAWQAVLGDVANFAISCTPKGCAVFVAAVAKADAKPAPAQLAITPASSELTAPTDLAAALEAGTAVATTAPPAGARRDTENSESEN